MSIKKTQRAVKTQNEILPPSRGREKADMFIGSLSLTATAGRRRKRELFRSLAVTGSLAGDHCIVHRALLGRRKNHLG